MSCINLPNDRDNDLYSYMSWSMITNEGSPQYRLRENYIKKGHPIYDPDGLADIFGRKIVAVTSTIGDIGDEIEIIFQNPLRNWRNGNSLEAIIGDEKDQNDTDPPCDKYGHLYGNYQRCVVEFIVQNGLFHNNRTIKKVFPCLNNNPVIKIKNNGKNLVYSHGLL